VQSIAEDLRRAAHDVRLLARTTEEALPGARASRVPDTTGGHPTGVGHDDGPALTSPVSVPRPDPDNWVLVGSLLEDLRRVREEIIG
jgi:hypothetical protein